MEIYLLHKGFFFLVFSTNVSLNFTIYFQGTMVPGLLYFICAVAGVLTMVMLIFVPETNNKDLQDLLVDAPSVDSDTETAK